LWPTCGVVCCDTSEREKLHAEDTDEHRWAAPCIGGWANVNAAGTNVDTTASAALRFPPFTTIRGSDNCLGEGRLESPTLEVRLYGEGATNMDPALPRRVEDAMRAKAVDEPLACKALPIVLEPVGSVMEPPIVLEYIGSVAEPQGARPSMGPHAETACNEPPIVLEHVGNVKEPPTVLEYVGSVGPALVCIIVERTMG